MGESSCQDRYVIALFHVHKHIFWCVLHSRCCFRNNLGQCIIFSSWGGHAASLISFSSCLYIFFTLQYDVVVGAYINNLGQCIIALLLSYLFSLISPLLTSLLLKIHTFNLSSAFRFIVSISLLWQGLFATACFPKPLEYLRLESTILIPNWNTKATKMTMRRRGWELPHLVAGLQFQLGKSNCQRLQCFCTLPWKVAYHNGI